MNGGSLKMKHSAGADTINVNKVWLKRVFESPHLPSADKNLINFRFAKHAGRLLGRARWAQRQWLRQQHDLRFGSKEVRLRV